MCQPPTANQLGLITQRCGWAVVTLPAGSKQSGGLSALLMQHEETSDDQDVARLHSRSASCKCALNDHEPHESRAV